MKKKLLSGALTLVMVLSMVPAAFAAGGTACASTQAVEVDGKKVEFQMYALNDANGNPTNYVKLRDVAHVLNGTKAQFAVGYDGAISVTTGTAYTDVGGEMSTPYSGDRAYRTGSGAVKVNGQAASLESIILTDDAGGDYTYFKLRDLGAALGFQVDWSAQRGVFIETGAAQSTGDPNLDLFQGAWKGSFKNSDGDTVFEEIIITGNQFESLKRVSEKGKTEVYKGSVLVQTNMVRPSEGKTYPYVLTLTFRERMNRKTGEMRPYENTQYYYVNSIDSGAGQVNWHFSTYNRINTSDPNTLYAGVRAELAELEAQKEYVKKYPTYAEFPYVPDYGAIFGIDLVKKEESSVGSSAIYYHYSYSGKRWDEYVKILEECGFKRTAHKNIFGETMMYYDGMGYSVTDIPFVEGETYASSTFEIVVQIAQS